MTVCVQVTIYHILKLFQSSPGTSCTTTAVLPASATPNADVKKLLVAEAYEELVFQVCLIVISCDTFNALT